MQAKRISIQKTDGAVYSTECMMCGECISRCPSAGAARLTLFGKTLTEAKPRRIDKDGKANALGEKVGNAFSDGKKLK